MSKWCFRLKIGELFYLVKSLVTDNSLQVCRLIWTYPKENPLSLCWCCCVFLSATLLIQRMWMSFNLHVKRIFYRIENKNVSIGNIDTLNKLCKSKNTNRSYSEVFTMNYWLCLRWINHCYCCCSLSVLCLCCSPKSLRFKPKKW